MTGHPDHGNAIIHIKKIVELEQQGARHTILVGPYSAFLLISVLQLALRHPEMSDQIKEVVSGVITDLKKLFQGTPLAELLDKGDNPEFDV